MQNIDYTVAFQKRKTLSIIVETSQEVLVKAPLGTSKKYIDNFIKDREVWILKQKKYFSSFQEHKKINYIVGDTIFYLGKEYNLLIEKSLKNKVFLKENNIIVFSKEMNNSDYIKNILDKWFSDMAKAKFTERLSVCFKIFNAKYKSVKPLLTIRRMKRRWGTLIIKKLIFRKKQLKISLNTKLIHASNDCLDYVVMHELCHIKHQNHSKQFYECLSDFVPNWKILKKKLEKDISYLLK